MRALSWIAGSLVALILLAVAAAWLVPPMLDWDRYRDDIATLASREFGRDVHIDGPVTLSLLPQPTLTASDVHIDQADDGVTVAVSALRLRVALGSLFGGRIDAQELVLRGFDMRLPWPIESHYGMRAPTWLSALSARIEQGRLTIGDFVVGDVDATVSAGGLTGAYQAAGTGTVSGRSWHFVTRLTQPGADGSAGLDVALDGQGPVQGVGIVLSAQFSGDGTLGGQLNARGPDLSQLLPAPKVPFRAEGRVTVAGGLAEADDLSVDIGGSPARGAVAFRLTPEPRLDVALAASRLDLDSWLPTLLQSGTPALSLGVDLSAEAANLAGGTLRRVRGAFDLSGPAIDIRELRAVLPGEAELELTGRIDRHDVHRPYLEGDAHLLAPALRTTFGWLEGAGLGALSSLPPGVFRTAELSGHVRVGSGEIAVGDLKGRVDTSTVTGTAAAHIGTRLAISAGLSADRLDLDPWLPDQVPGPEQVGAKLRPFDVDLRLAAGQAIFRGVGVAPFLFDAMAQDGRLTVRRLDMAAADTTIVASGSIIEGGRVANARLDLRARDATPLAGVLPPGAASAALRAPALLRNRLHVQVVASGPPEALGLELVADLGDLHLESQPTIDLPSGSWSGPVTLRHPGAPRLAEALGVQGAPAWLGDGSLAIVASVVAAPGRVAADSLDVTAGAFHASGRLAMDRGERGIPRVTGRLAAESLPLPLPYARSPDPLPMDWLKGWHCAIALQADEVLVGESPILQKASGNLKVNDGSLQIDGFTAGLGGGALSGSLAFDATPETPAMSLTARVSGAVISSPFLDLPLDIAKGTVDGNFVLRAAGHSLGALLATVAGSAQVTVRDGVLTGISLPPRGGDLSAAAVEAALAGGVMPFQMLQVDAELAHGDIIVRSATVKAESGSARISGSIDLPGESADLHVVEQPVVADPPEFGVRLNGPFDEVKRTPELAGLAEWRASHATRAAADTAGSTQEPASDRKTAPASP